MKHNHAAMELYFLKIINDNWTTITVVIGLALILYRKIKDFLKKSDDEKIEIALKKIKETMLDYVSLSEDKYSEWKEAGSLKRAQVIKQLYVDYPELSSIYDQDELIKKIDEMIDSALPELRKVINQNIGK